LCSCSSCGSLNCPLCRPARAAAAAALSLPFKCKPTALSPANLTGSGGFMCGG
jgi:hypothetical protein